MKSLQLIFSLSLCLFLTCCQSPSDQIKDTFQTVDKSLKKSNQVLSNSIEELYSVINANRQNNEQLSLKADSIYTASNKAIHFIDSLQHAMLSQDTSGTDLNLATKTLIATNTGNNLTKLLSNVYTAANSYSIDKSKKKQLDTALQSFKEIQSDKQWAKKYFEMTPTVAAVTMLSKFQNDCTNVAVITLGDIKEHLTN